MNDKSRTRLDLKALQEQLPADRAELFLGFVPWAEDAEGWRRSVRAALPEVPGRSVLRTVWDSLKTVEERVLIDVVECESAASALEALADRLQWNQLAQVADGPRGLGQVAFMHPEGVPPAIVFTRGNVCLNVASFGRQAVDVVPWAEGLNRRLDHRPAIKRSTIELSVGAVPLKAGQATELRYVVPWKYGENGYLKFIVAGGTLFRREERLFLAAAGPGEMKIDAYLLEPGREPHAGHLRLGVE